MSNNEPRVAVIGAGIVGAALAFELSDRGASVTLIDSSSVLGTNGATSNSFAWITNQSFFRAQDPVPEDIARDYFGLHRLALGAWRRLEHRVEPLGVRWNGTLQWAGEDDEEGNRLQEELVRRQAWGSPSFQISAQELQDRLPTANPGVVGTAFFTPDEGTVNPFTVVKTLIEASQQNNTTVIENSTVTRLAGTGEGRVLVTHDGGTIACDKVVIACGRQTPVLAEQAGIHVPLIESVGELIHLEAQDMFLDPLVLAPRVHAIQRHDGRVILARHFTGLPVTDVGSLNVESLLADARQLFPQLANSSVENVTQGRRVLPSGATPLIGSSSQIPGVRAIATNAGITLGPVLAQLLTTEILDDVSVDTLDRFRIT